MEIYKYLFLNVLLVLFIICDFRIIYGMSMRKKNALMHVKHKDSIKEEVLELRKRSSKSCTDPNRKGDKVKHLSRHPRDVHMSRQSDHHAVYFSGAEILRLKTFYSNIPRKNFTLSLTVNPEGGQYDPVTILELVDTCNGRRTHNWLKIGLKTENKRSNLKYFVSLKTERSKRESIIYADNYYNPGEWTNLDITHDQHFLKLYRNGALVSVARNQNGAVFPEVSQHCKTLVLGGDENTDVFYRGSLTNLYYWNFAKSHSELKIYNKDNKQLFIHDSFSNLRKWRSVFKIPPRILNNIKVSNFHSLVINSPPCGQTVCDDPTIMQSYKEEPQLRHLKEVSYKVFNLMNDDGSMPQITRKQLHKQQIALTSAFAPYNISFKQTTKNIRNTFLRNAVVLYACDPSSIGDNVCDGDCFIQQTGYDGGDCDHLLPVVPECDFDSIGDGSCDVGCNKFVWDWDGGDCCTEGSKQCFDPLSPYRAYISKDELKLMIGEDSSDHLNIYLATSMDRKMAGLSTYPWDNHIYGLNGGILMPPESFGASEKSKGLVHEIGHVLGLWHVHHGISEMDCNDPCRETHASPELGDLCSDTKPTPENTKCSDPGKIQTTCESTTFRDTPYRNFMSYADDSCIDEFTNEQNARMHCYLDLVYQPWRNEKLPSPVPLPPKIISASNNSVTIKWVPPLGTMNGLSNTVCDICHSHEGASQYAYNASASHPPNPMYIWQPKHAIGPPDAETCVASSKTWMMPDTFTCDHLECYLRLQFNYRFIPERLTIWVPYTGIDEDVSSEKENSIKYIEVITDDNAVIPLGSFPVSCDVFLSVALNVRRPVTEVVVYIANPYVAIDAVELSSSIAVPECKTCRKQKYRLYRDSNFQSDRFHKTSETEFEDKDLKPNKAYRYSVTVVRGPYESLPSPPAIYTVGHSFCGDGLLDHNEQCDDGNVDDGDGCSINCQEEESFKCAGEPSRCYVHDGDGVCEDYEKPYSVRDCGYFTPDGFLDQWVVEAKANPDFQSGLCPESILFGIPNTDQKCLSNTIPVGAWYPCNNQRKQDNYWIEMFFPIPKVASEIILHLGSDGIDEINEEPKIRVELLTTDNMTLPLKKFHSVSCDHNPLHIPIVHDLTKPFYMTKGIRVSFSSPRISLAGARIRSSIYLDPVTIASCEPENVYDIRTGRCLALSCERGTCGQIIVDHASSDCTGKSEGDICLVKCNPGYKLNHVLNTIMCTNGTWVNQQEMQCIPISCGEPYIPYASAYCPEGHKYGDECNFNCKAPSRLQGEISTIKCEADGKWSMPNSFCQIYCKAPADIAHADLMTKACKRGYHPLGKVCKFKCEKEYMVDGQPKFRKIFKLDCNEDGSWKGGKCVPITCPEPDPMFYGAYTCTDYFNVGSECSIPCPDNRKQVITCQYDGDWDGHFKVCADTEDKPCDEIGPSDVRYRCSGDQIGDNCKAHCYLPNAKPVLKEKSTTGIATTQSNGEENLTITCTVRREWYPNPDSIICQIKCDKDFVGDGLCQGDYNTEACAWDGGDCCESTVEDGIVIPLSCHQSCDCLDPNAKENLKSRKRRNHKKRTRNKMLSLSRYFQH